MFRRPPTTRPQSRKRKLAKWRRFYRSLQFKASLLVLLLVLAVVTGGAALSLRASSATLVENELDRAQEWAIALAAGAEVILQSRNSEKALHEAVRKVMATGGIAYIAFSDPCGEILAIGENRSGLLTSHGTDSNRMGVPTLDTPRVRTFDDGAVTVIDVVTPIYAGPRPQQTNASPGIAGYLKLGTDITTQRARLQQTARQLLRIALGIVLLVVPCSMVLTRHIVAPLHELSKATRAIANGALNARAPVRNRDEIGELATAFNMMANRVAQSQMELLQLASELEVRVEERTRELEELASRDPLTGLYNRRYFSEVIAREFAAAQRYDSDLTCLMFDLDYFKQINDQFGHGTGDEVIGLLARAVQGQLRSADIAARFGGDEFILLLPQTADDDANGLATRISEQFRTDARHRWPDLPASLSIGVASLHTTAVPSAERLIKQADLALYAAKDAGRGCIRHAPPHPNTPILPPVR